MRAPARSKISALFRASRAARAFRASARLLSAGHGVRWRARVLTRDARAHIRRRAPRRISGVIIAPFYYPTEEKNFKNDDDK